MPGAIRIVDEELEKGLRSIAVPIVTRSGDNVAALNLSSHSSRAATKDLRDRFLPELQKSPHKSPGLCRRDGMV